MQSQMCELVFLYISGACPSLFTVKCRIPVFRNLAYGVIQNHQLIDLNTWIYTGTGCVLLGFPHDYTGGKGYICVPGHAKCNRKHLSLDIMCSTSCFLHGKVL